MATVTREHIARLVPETAPGADVFTLHQVARELWPSIRETTLLDLLAGLVEDGLVARVASGGAPFYRYYLTENR